MRCPHCKDIFATLCAKESLFLDGLYLKLGCSCRLFSGSALLSMDEMEALLKYMRPRR